MISKKIIFDKDKNVYMDALLYEKSDELPALKSRPAVVVCPGGGYSFCSKREADPVAMKYAAEGYNTFVLYYSLGKYSAYPNAVADLSKAIAHIRENAEEYGVIPDKIAVCGFSAGGHLAASLGTLWNRPEVQQAAGVKDEQNKPNALILGYAVTSTDWINSDAETCGERVSRGLTEEQREQLLNCRYNIGEHTPPTFLFHTAEDNLVPVSDSLGFAAEMVRHGRPVELHIFPHGGHGASLATALSGWEAPGVEQWMQLSVNWLSRTF